jgi:hypothetical protein
MCCNLGVDHDLVEQSVCPGHVHSLGDPTRLEFHQQRMDPACGSAAQPTQIPVPFREQLQHLGMFIDADTGEPVGA